MARINKNKLDEIAPRMRHIRRLFGENQRQFATRIGISLSHYSKLETGTGNIGEGVIQTLAAVAGCAPEWIRSGLGSPPPADPRCPLPSSIAPPSTTANKAGQPLHPNTDICEKILILAENSDLRQLALAVSAQLGLPFNRALASLIAECLVKP